MIDTPHAISIRTEVKKIVADASRSGLVRQKLVEQLTQDEIDNRVAALTTVLIKRDETQREIEKIEKNPANKVYIINPGDTEKVDAKKPTSGSWTEEQIQSLNKLREKLAKIDKAIDMALDPEAPDFSKVKELAN
jgi:hypothetical protein